MTSTLFVKISLIVFVVTISQIYGARRLMGLTIVPFQLLAFSLLQSGVITLLSCIMPFHGLRLILQSITNMTFQMWIFKARLFPETLFGAIGPLLFAFLGELVFPPLFLYFFDSSAPWATFWGTTQEPFTLTAFLPIILLSLYLLRERNNPKRTKKKEGDSNPPFKWRFLREYGFFLPMIILHKTFALSTCNHNSLSDLIFGQAFLYSGSLMLPVICIALIQSIANSEQDQKAINYHTGKCRLQSYALRVLREERHDFLNELTLISSYVQMERWQDAQDCIAYAAASLSDRYNYATLPPDAWLTVLEFKQKEAQQRHIEFDVQILVDPPTDFAERRLLPKLIINLVDNAFTAASKAPNPKVQLCWYEQPNGIRTLLVMNNGAPIPLHQARQIFQGGFTSKKDKAGNNGWGLVICKRIAEELGGDLTFESSLEQTKFILTLPTPGAQEVSA